MLFGFGFSLACLEFFNFYQKDTIMYFHRSPNVHLDKVNKYLEDVTSTSYTHNIIKWELKNKIYTNTGEILDYIQYGKLMAGGLQEEISFHCYYIAHLKDHKNVKTNGELAFDTYASSSNISEQD